MTLPMKVQEKNKQHRKITEKQAEFLTLICMLLRRDSVSPTLEELAVARGVTKSTAAAYVRRLKAAGRLVQVKGKFRTIRPAKTQPAGAREGEIDG
jgi:DNA-binding MarR family transcriptional regulator